jgi:hypothetical protein
MDKINAGVDSGGLMERRGFATLFYGFLFASLLCPFVFISFHPKPIKQNYELSS